MGKLADVTGATRNQAGSGVRALKDASNCRVQGVTSDVLSEKSKNLVALSVEMVAADLDDRQSLMKVFEGASVIFGITDYGRQLVKYNPVQAQEREYQ